MNTNNLEFFFAFCPACGAANKGERGLNPFRCQDCGFELHFNTATSAAAIISDENGRIVMIERKKPPRKGKLAIPGGFVNSGEPLEAALAREIREELNLDLVDWTYLGSWPNRYEYKSVIYSVSDVYYVAKVEDFQPMASCNSEVASIVMADPDSLSPSDLAFPTIGQALKRYKRLQDRKR